MDFELLRWRVDPDSGWHLRWLGGLVDKADWVGAEGVIEGLLAGGIDQFGLAVMDLIGCHQANTQMVMVLVVPVEEGPAEAPGVFDATEALWELRLVFQRLEAAFREWVVVGGVGPAVRFGDAQISEQQGGGLGFHGRAAVGVQGELARWYSVLVDGVFEQRLEK